MRTLVSSAAVVACFCLASLALAEETAWQKVVSKEGGVAAMFPGAAKVTKSPTGEQILLEADGGATVYLLQWNKLPAKIDITDEAVVKAFFDKGQAGALKSLAGSKLLEAEDTEFEDLPARELDLDAPGIGIYRTRMVLSGEKLYQVTIAGKKEVVEGDDAAAFLHSFRVLED